MADSGSDGTTKAIVELSDNHIGSDQVTDSYTSATYVNSSVGNNITVTISGISISGAAAGNAQGNLISETP